MRIIFTLVGILVCNVATADVLDDYNVVAKIRPAWSALRNENVQTRLGLSDVQNRQLGEMMAKLDPYYQATSLANLRAKHGDKTSFTITPEEFKTLRKSSEKWAAALRQIAAPSIEKILNRDQLRRLKQHLVKPIDVLKDDELHRVLNYTKAQKSSASEQYRDLFRQAARNELTNLFVGEFIEKSLDKTQRNQLKLFAEEQAFKPRDTSAGNLRVSVKQTIEESP